MNNKGFIASSVLYGIVALLFISFMLILSNGKTLITNNRNSASNVKKDIYNIDTKYVRDYINQKTGGHEICFEGVKTVNGVEAVYFPTYTIYGGKDDLDSNWKNTDRYKGEIDKTGKYCFTVNYNDHNNESGIYYTEVYIEDQSKKNNGDANHQYIFIKKLEYMVKYTGYQSILRLEGENTSFSRNKLVNHTLLPENTAVDNKIDSNFTIEFDAFPYLTTNIATPNFYANKNECTKEGATDQRESCVNNTIIDTSYEGMESNKAGIHVSVGTNGVSISYVRNDELFALLSYSANLNNNHRYRVSVSSNKPILYIDGKKVAEGITSPVTLTTNQKVNIGSPKFGVFAGTASNFILYSGAR